MGLAHNLMNSNDTTIGFALAMTVLVILSTVYMLWLVYKKKKYFSLPWIKEYGKSSICVDEDGEE